MRHGQIGAAVDHSLRTPRIFPALGDRHARCLRAGSIAKKTGVSNCLTSRWRPIVLIFSTSAHLLGTSLLRSDFLFYFMAMVDMVSKSLEVLRESVSKISVSFRIASGHDVPAHLVTTPGDTNLHVIKRFTFGRTGSRTPPFGPFGQPWWPSPRQNVGSGGEHPTDTMLAGAGRCFA